MSALNLQVIDCGADETPSTDVDTVNHEIVAKPEGYTNRQLQELLNLGHTTTLKLVRELGAGSTTVPRVGPDGRAHGYEVYYHVTPEQIATFQQQQQRKVKQVVDSASKKLERQNSYIDKATAGAESVTSIVHDNMCEEIARCEDHDVFVQMANKMANKMAAEMAKQMAAIVVGANNVKNAQDQKVQKLTIETEMLKQANAVLKQTIANYKEHLPVSVWFRQQGVRISKEEAVYYTMEFKRQGQVALARKLGHPAYGHNACLWHVSVLETLRPEVARIKAERDTHLKPVAK